jgi:uncharacterized alpha-E superfamily protein
MARYIERAESLARILDVTESFGQGHDAGANWAQVLDLFSDRAAYKKRHGAIQARNVIRFYLLDKTNENSILASLGAAHSNARTLRHLISVEMWTHLNVFYNELLELRARDVTQQRLSAVCQDIKHGCQLFQGSTQNTLYRDQVWQFYRIGRLIERCDQTTRLIDIKTSSVLAGKRTVADSVDVSQWHTLLRAASAYHGYLRVNPRELTAELAAGYVLFDPGFPGSLAFCTNELGDALKGLEGFVDKPVMGTVKRQLRVLNKLAKPSSTKVAEGTLHDFLDSVQSELTKMHLELGKQFFPKAS